MGWPGDEGVSLISPSDPNLMLIIFEHYKHLMKIGFNNNVIK
jgi:hypothetical protein